MAKIKATQIIISRAEGLHKECYSSVCNSEPGYDAWQQSDDTIRRMARTAPADGSYHKCDFSIKYEDGYVYEGRFDMKRHDRQFSNHLGRHIYQHNAFMAGQWRSFYTEPEYQRVLALNERANPGVTQERADYLSRYEIGSGDNAESKSATEGGDA